MLVNNLFKYWIYRAFTPGTVLRPTYEAFQKLLEYDGRIHEEISELEALYFQDIKDDFSSIRKRYKSFSTNVVGMVEILEKITLILTGKVLIKLHWPVQWPARVPLNLPGLLCRGRRRLFRTEPAHRLC